MNLATIGWPSGTDTGWPFEPRNMLPGRVEGFPAGVQASANTAERLLSQAVGWWDAVHYRDGDRLLRNRGVAGELLDLQLGSSGRVATSNDPLFLAPEDSGYVYLPGTSALIAGNCMTVPDAANLRLTSDVEMVFRVQSDDWTPSVTVALGGKDVTSTSRGYALLLVASTGTLRFTWSPDGTDAGLLSAYSTVSVPFSDGDAGWIKVQFDADNGASGRTTRFYTAADSETEPSSWTQLGSDVTSAGATSIYATTQPVSFGFSRQGSANWNGRAHRMIIKDGIDGTTVLDIDCDAITSGSQTSFTAVTGQTVTINRSTSGRKSVAVPSRANRGGALFLFGTDDYMEVVNKWQHRLLNFDAGDSFTVLAVVRDWNQNANGTWIAKTNTVSSSMDGWVIYNDGGTPLSTFRFGDGSRVFTSIAPAANGDLSVMAGVRNVVTDTGTPYLNDVAGSSISDTTTGTLANSHEVRVGRLSSTATTYGDMEFIAAAVFRKALTAGEVATLTNYFQGRAA